MQLQVPWRVTDWHGSVWQFQAMTANLEGVLPYRVWGLCPHPLSLGRIVMTLFNDQWNKAEMRLCDF